ncbi:hypothetical protein NQZ68_032205, partial [Dissostichus eleginoides]
SPLEFPLKSLLESSLEFPLESPLESPLKSPLESLLEFPLESPLKSPLESLLEFPLESPLESPLEFPLKSPLKSPLESLLEFPLEFLLQSPLEFPLNHGKMFAHWTETSKALLRGEGPPVFRVRKLDDITEKEEQIQPHPADVSVGKDVEKTMEAPTSKIVQDCKKAAEWVVAHKHLCTRVHLPDAVSMGEAQLREAVKLWEEKPDECDED